jgi:hypothetical protein
MTIAMKQPGKKYASTTGSPPAGIDSSPFSLAGIVSLAALLIALCLYAPALRGAFIFDDLSLPFALGTRDTPLAGWLSGVRPVLMLSYWMNARIWGYDPLGFHALNLVIHALNTGLVFLVLHRLLTKAQWTAEKANLASLAGAGIFLIHPLQTESVSYVAGRSESLLSLFVLLAYVIFLYRRHESISWLEAVSVLTVFAIAIGTKENAVSLAGILLLTDLFWPTPFSLRGIKSNWRLYLLMLPGVVIAAAAVFRLLATAQTAGFSSATVRWYQYGFTEARAIFSYLRLTLLPIGQSIDHDYPTSYTIAQHGAFVCLIVLAALLIGCVVWRRRYPLSCFGLLMFLIFLAPTSSIVPIDDSLVERRMYLPILGLILIGCEVMSHFSRRTACCVLSLAALLFGTLCYTRNQLWGKPEKLLEFAAEQSVYNPRPMLNFTGILIRHDRCALAIPYLERAERRLPDNYYVHAAWGRTLACLGRYPEAMDRLRRAARLQPCAQVYEWIGLVYGQMRLPDESKRALQKAVELAPDSQSAHGSLALCYEEVKDFSAAEQEYRRALTLNRNDLWAQTGLVRVHTAKLFASRP